MANEDQVVGIDAAPSLIEQLGKAFLELDSHRGAAEIDLNWSEIKGFFQHLEEVANKRNKELELREMEFKQRETETLASIAEKEAAVAYKEQELFDRIQELKDSAVAVIVEARAKHLPEPIDVEDNKENKVSSSLGDTNELVDVPEEKSEHKTDENAGEVAGEVKPRPELIQFCEQMDAKGLLNYMKENQKNIDAIRLELFVALESAAEPARLVLESLEGFFPPDDNTQEGNKNDAAALQGSRLSCFMFMEALANLLAARDDPGADYLLNPEIKQQAKAIADEWKPKLANAATDATNENSLEAEAFLQLIATFKIASEFDEEDLCKIVLAVAYQRRVPELCRSLGLAHKMAGVVESLVNNGKQIDAVHFIHAFKLTESFPPVPLLKTYLKDLRRNSQGKPGNSGNASGGQIDVNAQELAALRAVIGCVKEYKLEADYPLDPLQKRVTQLEKTKPDRKRSLDSGKHQQHKKPRANGGSYGHRAQVPAHLPAGGGGRHVRPVYAERAVFAGGISERYPHAAPTAYDYQAPPSQSAYAQPGYDQRAQYYPPDNRVPAAMYNAAAAAPSSYGGYAGGGAQPSHQPYM